MSGWFLDRRYGTRARGKEASQGNKPEGSGEALRMMSAAKREAQGREAGNSCESRRRQKMGFAVSSTAVGCLTVPGARGIGYLESRVSRVFAWRFVYAIRKVLSNHTFPGHGVDNSARAGRHCRS